MKQYIKTSEEITKMRTVGQMAADVLEMITPYVQEDITTLELDTLCHNYIVHTQKAIPAPLNYHGYPKSICTSINEVVCHGIPENRLLQKGDCLNIDVTVLFDGYHGDTSAMFTIGKVSPQTDKLIEVTRDCLLLALQLVKPGTDLKKIGRIIQKYAHFNGFTVVEDFCGHGIGSIFHEPLFQVLHYDTAYVPSFILEEGMTFTIEPMINAGKKKVRVLKDNWTAVTQDGSVSAQWEHTLLVTSSGCDVLTVRKNENLHVSKNAEIWMKNTKIT